MKKLKRISIMLIISLILCAVSSFVKAVGPTIAFSKSSANVGDKVTVTVNGSGIEGIINLAVSGNATLSDNSVSVKNSSASVVATITGNGDVTITATPSNGTVNSSTKESVTTPTAGTIKVGEDTSSKSSVATLANLGIRPKDFTGFSPTKYSYSTEVSSDTESIEVYASEGQKGQKVSGTGKKTLKEGKNEFNVVVTAADGKTQKTYTIAVTRKESGSSTDSQTSGEKESTSISTTKQIKIPSVDLVFDSNIYTYNVDLKENLDRLDLTELLTELGDDTEVVGNENLHEGENTITITVKGKNGEEPKIYQIIVNKILAKEENNIENKDDQEEKRKTVIVAVAASIILVILIAIIVVKIKRDGEFGFGYNPYTDVVNNYLDSGENSENQEPIDLSDNLNNYVPDTRSKPVKKRRRHVKGKRFK